MVHTDGCGFCLWPTKAKLPDGSPYGYNVGAKGAAIQVSGGRRAKALRRRHAPLEFAALQPVLTSHSRCPAFDQDDVLQMFVDSAKAAGVGYGFYYSIMKSFYLCHSFSGTNSCGSKVLPGQHNYTDQQYTDVVKTQVTELWSNCERPNCQTGSLRRPSSLNPRLLCLKRCAVD